MEKFRILLLNSLHIYGGGEFYVLQLTKSLKLQGHKVWISCPPDSLLFEKCKLEDIRVLPLAYPKRDKGSLISIVNQIKKFSLNNNIQIIHSNTNYDRTAGAFAAYLAKTASVTTVHSYHSISHNLTHWLRNKYLIDAFIADSMKIKNLLLEQDNIAESKVSLINIGIDPDKMKRNKEAGEAIRKELSIPEDAIVIGNVGRMVEFKGQEFLIKAFADCLKKTHNLVLIITGDGKLKNDLLELADNIGVKREIRLTGFRDDLDSLYSAFDIYAHTSIEGGGELFPVSVLNALAQGLPVIASDAGDISAMVTNGKNGFLTPPKDIEKITEGIIELVNNKLLRFDMGKNSRKLFMENFTEDKMIAKILKVYSRILNS
jgi:glycosyltransferase involved in cell wall biosynthesis